MEIAKALRVCSLCPVKWHSTSVSWCQCWLWFSKNLCFQRDLFKYFFVQHSNLFFQIRRDISVTNRNYNSLDCQVLNVPNSGEKTKVILRNLLCTMSSPTEAGFHRPKPLVNGNEGYSPAPTLLRWSLHTHTFVTQSVQSGLTELIQSSAHRNPHAFFTKFFFYVSQLPTHRRLKWLIHRALETHSHRLIVQEPSSSWCDPLPAPITTLHWDE